MISVDEALKIVLDSVSGMGTEEINIQESFNRILGEDIVSDINIPGFDNSSMDGFAVIAEDIALASEENPATLEIIDKIRAGSTSKRTLSGKQAIKIMTGATIPKGANSVVMVEDTRASFYGKEAQEHVNIFKAVNAGENIRYAGESIKKGGLVMEKGETLTPAHIGMLASLGISKIKVSKKPRVAILATGDEIVGIGEEITGGKIRSANNYTLSALMEKCGAIPVNMGIVKDDIDEIEARIRECLDCDVIITSGGVSVGDFDFVKDVVEEKLNADIKFWKVAVKPGKPILFALKGGKPIFGLPGNPVSSMVSVEMFVRPAISKMLSKKVVVEGEVDAVILENLKRNDKRRHLVRAVTEWKGGQYQTISTGSQSSGILQSLVKANSLIIFPETIEKIKKGDKVKVRFL